MAFLKDVFSTLFSGGKKSRSVVGIDIGSSSIKVIQLRAKRGVAVLETYGEIALGPYGGVEVGRATNLPTDKLIAALTDVLREANVTTVDCGISIPFSSSLVTLIKMPAVPGGRLAQMIPLEARKYIPVPISEVSLDWFVVPGESGAAEEEAAVGPRTIDVLLVAIHNETIAKYREVLKAVGLRATFLEIEVFSSVRAALDHGIAPVAVIDLGAATTKVYLVEHGIVRESHILNRGSQDITLSLSKSLSISVLEAEKRKREMGLMNVVGGDVQGGMAEVSLLTLQYIFSEVHRILLSYQERRNKVVAKVVLTGGGALLKGITEFSQKKIELPVELANPFSKTETPAFLGEVLREAGPEFTVSLGVALRKLEEGN